MSVSVENDTAGAADNKVKSYPAARVAGNGERVVNISAGNKAEEIPRCLPARDCGFIVFCYAFVAAECSVVVACYYFSAHV